MNKELQVFEHEMFGKIRVMDREGNPWFVANEIAKALGYSDPKKAITMHCKYSVLLKGDESSPLTFSPRGIKIIPEKDIYRLVMRSGLEAAEKFQDWVYDEVLPSIRRTGKYDVTEKTDSEKAVILARAVLKSDKKLKALELKRKKDKPKVESYDKFISTKGLVTLQEAGKQLGVKPNIFIAKLRDVKILFKRKNVNFPFQPYLDKGWFDMKVSEDSMGNPRSQTFVTTIGLAMFHQLIKKGLMEMGKKPRLPRSDRKEAK